MGKEYDIQFRPGDGALVDFFTVAKIEGDHVIAQHRDRKMSYLKSNWKFPVIIGNEYAAVHCPNTGKVSIRMVPKFRMGETVICDRWHESFAERWYESRYLQTQVVAIFDKHTVSGIIIYLLRGGHGAREDALTKAR